MIGRKHSGQDLHVLIGMVHPTMPGGILVTESRTIDEIRKVPGVSVTLFGFGGRSVSESRYRKVFDRAKDIAHYCSMLIREKPDVVMINSAFSIHGLLRDILFSVASFLFRQPLFIKMHGSDLTLLDRSSKFLRGIARVMIRCASLVGLLSTAERRMFIARGLPAEKFVLVCNSIDAERFATDRGPDDTSARLLFIARMVPSKGLLDLLHAVRIVLDQGKSVQLWCVGDGPQRVEAEQLSRQLSLTTVVSFVGHVSEEEARQYYVNASMLVFPTLHEGFSMTLFQSAAAGLPIITTRVGAAADYLSEPDNVLWVVPHDQEMIAGRIVYLIEHPDVAAGMARNNRALVHRFSPDKVAEDYLEIFRRLSRRKVVPNGL